MNDSPSPPELPQPPDRGNIVVLLAFFLVPMLAVGALFVHFRQLLGDVAEQWDETSMTAYAEPAEDPAVIKAGAAIFHQHCERCHLLNDSVGIGPNLRQAKFGPDGYQKLFMTVAEGRQHTAMVAWKHTLTPEQVYHVTSYVWSVIGQEPADTSTP